MMNQSYLYKGLKRLIKQNYNDQDQDYLFRRFHILQKNKQSYIKNLKESFNIQKQDYKQSLLNAKYLAYLVNYEPQFADLIQMQRKRYVSFLYEGMNQSQYCFKLISKLIIQQNSFILQNIEKDIQSTKIHYNQADAIFHLTILEGKMNWQLQKKQKTINMCWNDNMKTFIVNALNFVCRKMQTNINTIIFYKIKLLNLIFDFMGDQVKQFTEQMIDTLNEYLSLEFYNGESINSFFLLVQKYIKHFDTKIFHLIIPFIYNSVNKFANYNFLVIIKLILNIYKRESKLIDIQLMKYLQSNMMDMLLSNQIQEYRSKWMIIEILLTFSFQFNLNFPKQIIMKITNSTISNQYLQCLIIAITVVQEPKLQLNEHSINHLHQNNLYKQVFKDRKEFQIYQSVLFHFSDLHEEFQDFICNPQIGQGIIETFLTIKTTVFANFQILSNNKRVQNLLKTLIKFVLIDIYSQYSMDIIQELINKAHLDTQSYIKDISISNIIKQMIPLILKKIELQNKVSKFMFYQLQTLIKIINKKFSLRELLTFDIFQVCIELISYIPKRYYNTVFFKPCLNLLQLVLPHEKYVYQHPKLLQNHPIIKQLINILIQHPNAQFFKLYLIILNNVKFTDNAKDFLRYKQFQIKDLENKEDFSQIFDQFFDNYNMAEFIIDRSAYSYHAQMLAWQIMIKHINQNSFQMIYNIFDILMYFKFAICNNNVKDDIREDQHILVTHLRGNIKKCIQIVKILDKMIDNSVFYEQIKEIMAFKLRILMHLCEIYCYYYRYQRIHDIKQIYELLNDSFSKNKIQYYMDIFNGNQKLQKATEFWCQSQILYFFLTPLVYSTTNQIIEPYNAIRFITNLQANFESIRHFFLINKKKIDRNQTKEKVKKQKETIKQWLNKIQELFICNLSRWEQAITQVQMLQTQ